MPWIFGYNILFYCVDQTMLYFRLDHLLWRHFLIIQTSLKKGYVFLDLKIFAKNPRHVSIHATLKMNIWDDGHIQPTCMGPSLHMEGLNQQNVMKSCL